MHSALQITTTFLPGLSRLRDVLQIFKYKTFDVFLSLLYLRSTSEASLVFALNSQLSLTNTVESYVVPHDLSFAYVGEIQRAKRANIPCVTPTGFPLPVHVRWLTYGR